MSTSDSTTTLSRRPKKAKSDDVGGIAAQQLRAFVERIERLEEEKKALADDIKEVYAEAKGNGFLYPLSGVLRRDSQALS
jgi:hypothetical protein